MDDQSTNGPGGLAVVTGAASGLGRAMASALVDDGYRVAAIDIDADGLSSLAAGHPDGCVRTFVADVGERQQVDAALTAALGADRLRVLINNAGVLSNRGVLEVSEQDWLRVIQTNLTGAFWVAQRTAAEMVRQGGGGRIVNIGSITGKIPRYGEAAYCASKAGLSQLSRVLALELAPHAITVNTLSPGSADAGVLWHHLGGDRTKADIIIHGDAAKFRLGIPLGTLATEEDVVAAMRFLISPGARHITGHELYVDGGQAMF